MLERPTLLLRPWAASGPDGQGLRTVLDGGTGEPAGFVRRRPAEGPRWWRWLAGPVVHVYEAPDASLVFTIRHAWTWPRGWQVRDADERLVGNVRTTGLVDGLGHFLAAVEPPDGQGRGRFLAPYGRELGGYAAEGEATRVWFAAEVWANPFAKMLLLAAVLVRE